MGQWPPATVQWWNEKGRRPKNRPKTRMAHSQLPGAQPKEKMRPNCHSKEVNSKSAWVASLHKVCKLSRQLLVPIPQRPQQELDVLRLDEDEPPREAAVEPEPERQEELRVDPSAKKDKRLRSENTKADTLGSNPKAARDRARSQLRGGYHMSTSGRNSTRVLHRLGACYYMVPGIDYPRYMYSGPQIPKQGDFDSICKLCSRKGAESRTRRFRRYADVIVE